MENEKYRKMVEENREEVYKLALRTRDTLLAQSFLQFAYEEPLKECIERGGEGYEELIKDVYHMKKNLKNMLNEIERDSKGWKNLCSRTEMPVKFSEEFRRIYTPKGKYHRLRSFDRGRITPKESRSIDIAEKAARTREDNLTVLEGPRFYGTFLEEGFEMLGWE